MLLNKHGSFYIRNGWPTKIIDALIENNHIFSPNNELLAVDTIGVGRIMIKAMRYWAGVLGLATEGKDQQGVVNELSSLSKLIIKYDPFCNDIGTLWLLHRNLTSDFDNATAWNWAFNIYDARSFKKENFCEAFYSYLQKEGSSYSKTAVEKEFDCFKNTYVTDQSFSLAKVVEEDTIPFFAPLKLVEHSGNGMLSKSKKLAKDIPLDIFLSCILMDNQEHLKTNRQLDLDLVLEGNNQAGKYMLLGYSSIIELLQQLQNLNYLLFVNNFGHRYVEFNDIAIEELLKQHYILIGR